MSFHKIILVILIGILLFLIYKKNNKCINVSNNTVEKYRLDGNGYASIYVIFKDNSGNYKYDRYVVTNTDIDIKNIYSTINGISFIWKCQNDPVYKNNPGVQYVYNSYFQPKILKTGETLMELNSMVKYGNVTKDIVIGIGRDEQICIPIYKEGLIEKKVEILSDYVININNGNKLINKIKLLKLNDILYFDGKTPPNYFKFQTKFNNVIYITEKDIYEYTKLNQMQNKLIININKPPGFTTTINPDVIRRAYNKLMLNLQWIKNYKPPVTPDYVIPSNSNISGQLLGPDVQNIPYDLSQLDLNDQNGPLLQSFIDLNKTLLEASESIAPEEINNEIKNIFQQLSTGKFDTVSSSLPIITSPLIANSQPDLSSTLVPIKMGTRDYGSNNWTVYTGKAAPINNNWRSGYYLSTKNLGYGSQFGGVNTGDVVTMIIDIGTWNFKTANIFLLANTVQTTDISKYTTMNGTSGLFNNSPLILVGTDNIWDNLPKFDINNLPPSNISTLLINPRPTPIVYKIVISPQDVAYKKRYITISHSKVIKSVLVDIIFDL